MKLWLFAVFLALISVLEAVRVKRQSQPFPPNGQPCPASQQCYQQLDQIQDTCSKYNYVQGMSMTCAMARSTECDQLTQAYPEFAELQRCEKTFEDSMGSYSVESCMIHVRFEQCIGNSQGMTAADCRNNGTMNNVYPMPPMAAPFKHRIRRAIRNEHRAEQHRIKRQAYPIPYNHTDPCSQEMDSKIDECQRIETAAGCNSFPNTFGPNGFPGSAVNQQRMIQCNNTATQEYNALDQRESAQMAVAEQQYRACTQRLERQLWNKIRANPNSQVIRNLMAVDNNPWGFPGK